MPVPPGMKIAAQVSPEAADEELQFVKQMGIDWAVCWTDGEHAGYDYYARTNDRFQKAGIQIYGFGNREFTTRTRLFSGWKTGCQDRGVY